MKISNVSKKELYIALLFTNEKFEENIGFRDIEPLNKKETRWKVLLKAKDSRGLGAKRGFPAWEGFDKAPNWEKRRHLPYACWHAHGVFFDGLPSGARIYLASEGLHRPGDPWQDRQIGAILNPYFHSEACDCYTNIKTRPLCFNRAI